MTASVEVQLSTAVRCNERKWRGPSSSSYELRVPPLPPPTPTTITSLASNELDSKVGRFASDIIIDVLSSYAMKVFSFAQSTGKYLIYLSNLCKNL